MERFSESICKQEPKLIGYDESPIEIIPPDSINLETLKVQDPNLEANNRGSSTPFEAPEGQLGETSLDNSSETNLQITGISFKKSAKSYLYEICAANYWKQPVFECCKEEGPDHMKSFTFKVFVEIEEASNLVLECYGAPRTNKKAAAEHAAEGALWYLKHQGYLPKGE